MAIKLRKVNYLNVSVAIFAGITILNFYTFASIMHELSIATNIIEIAEEFAIKNNNAKISKIEIEVGELSGIVIASLEFALALAVKDTVLEHSQRLIIPILGQATCNVCHTQFPNSDWYTPCPKCFSMGFEITGGKELRIKSIFVD